VLSKETSAARFVSACTGGLGMSMLTAALVAAMFTGSGVCDPSGRILRPESVIEATVGEVWKAITATDGIESWMLPLCESDLRTGGTLRTTYQKAEGIGGPGTITHTLVSYERERVMCWKTKAPKDASTAVAKICEEGWSVLRLEPT